MLWIRECVSARKDSQLDNKSAVEVNVEDTQCANGNCAHPELTRGASSTQSPTAAAVGIWANTRRSQLVNIYNTPTDQKAANLTLAYTEKKTNAKKSWDTTTSGG